MDLRSDFRVLMCITCNQARKMGLKGMEKFFISDVKKTHSSMTISKPKFRASVEYLTHH